jgi:hypothetical protein
MSLNLNSKPGNDLEGSACESAALQIAERMPQPRRLEMPAMSDQELYLRLNVPDGLQSNGTWPTKYITQDTSGPSAIKHDLE